VLHQDAKPVYHYHEDAVGFSYNHLHKVMQLMEHDRERVLYVTIEAAD